MLQDAGSREAEGVGWAGALAEPDTTPAALSARQKVQAAITLVGSLRPSTILGD